jgi:hypothetical protein
MDDEEFNDFEEAKSAEESPQPGVEQNEPETHSEPDPFAGLSNGQFTGESI